MDRQKIANDCKSFLRGYEDKYIPETVDACKYFLFVTVSRRLKDLLDDEGVNLEMYPFSVHLCNYSVDESDNGKFGYFIKIHEQNNFTPPMSKHYNKSEITIISKSW